MVNESMYRVFSGHNFDVELIDTSVKQRTSRLVHAVSKMLLSARLLLNFKGRMKTLKQNETKPMMYLSLQAGEGTWIDLLFIRIAARSGAQILVHHHSFAYARTHWKSVAIISRTAAKVTHIVLSENMKEGLLSLYPDLRKADIVVIGNSWVIDSTKTADAPSHPAADGPIILGHLSNLTASKGLYRVIEIFEDLKRRGAYVQLSLAGPAHPKDQARIQALLQTHGGDLQWVGPVFDAKKEEWFNQIDAFLLPSTYSNEAYPLVVLESLSHSVPVLTSDIGCLGSVLSPFGSAVPIDSFQDAARAWVEEFTRDSASLSDAKRKALNSFQQLRAYDFEKLEELMANLR